MSKLHRKVWTVRGETFVEVSLDESKFDERFMAELREYFFSFHDTEGYGPLKDFDIQARVTEQAEEIESVAIAQNMCDEKGTAFTQDIIGSADLAPIVTPGRFDVGQLVLDDLRARVHHILGFDPMATIVDQQMTATEVLERLAEMTRIPRSKTEE